MLHMLTCEMQIVWWLAVLVECRGLTQAQTLSQYFLFRSPLPWHEARQFCQTHYVDLAVLGTEEQYFTLLDAIASERVSMWLGLRRQGPSTGWRWVDGEDLSYGHWYRNNYGCVCAGLEAMLKTDEKLLARFCKEPHAFLCQGPTAPQEVTVDSASDHLTLSWNVSAFMRTTPHSYNVTTCSSGGGTCRSRVYPHAGGAAALSAVISDLTPATEYSVEISASVVRPGVAGGNAILQSDPTLLKVRTADVVNVPFKMLKLLKVTLLAFVLWGLYICKKDDGGDIPMELLTEDTTVDLIPERTKSPIQRYSLLNIEKD